MLEKKNCFNCNNAKPVEIQYTTCICKAGKSDRRRKRDDSRKRKAECNEFGGTKSGSDFLLLFYALQCGMVADAY